MDLKTVALESLGMETADFVPVPQPARPPAPTPILGRITEALAASDRVELRSFGTFTARPVPARKGRNTAAP